MYCEIGVRHNIPHIHASYGEHNAVYDFEGNLLEGQLPSKENKMILAWIEIHKNELEANWMLLTIKGEYFKIEPLR